MPPRSTTSCAPGGSSLADAPRLRRSARASTHPAHGRTRVVGTLAALGATAFFSLNGALSAVAYDLGADPLSMSFWRAITSATVLILAILALRAIRGRPIFDHRRPDRRAWGWLGVGVLAVTVQNLGIFGAFEQTTVVVALVVFYAYPVMIGLASAALGLERMDARRWVALIGAFAGCALVVVGAGGTSDPTTGGNVLVGAVMALVAAAGQTVYVLASRHGFASVATPETVATLNLGPAVMILLLGLLAGDHGLDPTALTVQLASVYVLGAVLGQMVPMLLYQTGVRSIGPIDTATIAFAEPFFAAIVALIVVGQAFTPLQVAGGVLVAGSALVVQRRG